MAVTKARILKALMMGHVRSLSGLSLTRLNEGFVTDERESKMAASITGKWRGVTEYLRGMLRLCRTYCRMIRERVKGRKGWDQGGFGRNKHVEVGRGDKCLIPCEQAERWLLASLWLCCSVRRWSFVSVCLQRRYCSVAFVIGDWSCLYFVCLHVRVCMCAHFGSIPSAT